MEKSQSVCFTKPIIPLLIGQKTTYQQLQQTQRRLPKKNTTQQSRHGTNMNGLPQPPPPPTSSPAQWIKLSHLQPNASESEGVDFDQLLSGNGLSGIALTSYEAEVYGLCVEEKNLMVYLSSLAESCKNHLRNVISISPLKDATQSKTESEQWKSTSKLYRELQIQNQACLPTTEYFLKNNEDDNESEHPHCSPIPLFNYQKMSILQMEVQENLSRDCALSWSVSSMIEKETAMSPTTMMATTPKCLSSNLHILHGERSQGKKRIICAMIARSWSKVCEQQQKQNIHSLSMQECVGNGENFNLQEFSKQLQLLVGGNHHHNLHWHQQNQYANVNACQPCNSGDCFRTCPCSLFQSGPFDVTQVVLDYLQHLNLLKKNPDPHHNNMVERVHDRPPLANKRISPITSLEEVFGTSTSTSHLLGDNGNHSLYVPNIGIVPTNAFHWTFIYTHQCGIYVWAEELYANLPSTHFRIIPILSEIDLLTVEDQIDWKTLYLKADSMMSNAESCQKIIHYVFLITDQAYLHEKFRERIGRKVNVQRTFIDVGGNTITTNGGFNADIHEFSTSPSLSLWIITSNISPFEKSSLAMSLNMSTTIPPSQQYVSFGVNHDSHTLRNATTSMDESRLTASFVMSESMNNTYAKPTKSSLLAASCWNDHSELSNLFVEKFAHFAVHVHKYMAEIELTSSMTTNSSFTENRMNGEICEEGVVAKVAPLLVKVFSNKYILDPECFGELTSDVKVTTWAKDFCQHDYMIVASEEMANPKLEVNEHPVDEPRSKPTNQKHYVRSVELCRETIGKIRKLINEYESEGYIMEISDLTQIIVSGISELNYWNVTCMLIVSRLMRTCEIEKLQEKYSISEMNHYTYANELRRSQSKLNTRENLTNSIVMMLENQCIVDNNPSTSSTRFHTVCQNSFLIWFPNEIQMMMKTSAFHAYWSKTNHHLLDHCKSKSKSKSGNDRIQFTHFDLQKVIFAYLSTLQAWTIAKKSAPKKRSHTTTTTKSFLTSTILESEDLQPKRKRCRRPKNRNNENVVETYSHNVKEENDEQISSGSGNDQSKSVFDNYMSDLENLFVSQQWQIGELEFRKHQTIITHISSTMCKIYSRLKDKIDTVSKIQERLDRIFAKNDVSHQNVSKSRMHVESENPDNLCGICYNVPECAVMILCCCGLICKDCLQQIQNISNRNRSNNVDSFGRLTTTCPFCRKKMSQTLNISHLQISSDIHDDDDDDENNAHLSSSSLSSSDRKKRSHDSIIEIMDEDEENDNNDESAEYDDDNNDDVNEEIRNIRESNDEHSPPPPVKYRIVHGQKKVDDAVMIKKQKLCLDKKENDECEGETVDIPNHLYSLQQQNVTQHANHGSHFLRDFFTDIPSHPETRGIETIVLGVVERIAAKNHFANILIVTSECMKVASCLKKFGHSVNLHDFSSSSSNSSISQHTSSSLCMEPKNSSSSSNASTIQISFDNQPIIHHPLSSFGDRSTSASMNNNHHKCFTNSSRPLRTSSEIVIIGYKEAKNLSCSSSLLQRLRVTDLIFVNTKKMPTLLVEPIENFPIINSFHHYPMLQQIVRFNPGMRVHIYTQQQQHL